MIVRESNLGNRSLQFFGKKILISPNECPVSSHAEWVMGQKDGLFWGVFKRL